jgi:nitrate reductase gamma subunit
MWCQTLEYVTRKALAGYVIALLHPKCIELEMPASKDKRASRTFGGEPGMKVALSLMGLTWQRACDSRWQDKSCLHDFSISRTS